MSAIADRAQSVFIAALAAVIAGAAAIFGLLHILDALIALLALAFPPPLAPLAGLIVGLLAVTPVLIGAELLRRQRAKEKVAAAQQQLDLAQAAPQLAMLAGIVTQLAARRPIAAMGLALLAGLLAAKLPQALHLLQQTLSAMGAHDDHRAAA